MHARNGSSHRNPAFTILVLSLAPTVGLGIARFAYALILPDMRASPIDWRIHSFRFVKSKQAILGQLAAIDHRRTNHTQAKVRRRRRCMKFIAWQRCDLALR